MLIPLSLPLLIYYCYILPTGVSKQCMPLHMKMQHTVICTSKSHQKLNWIYSSADTNRTWRSDAIYWPDQHKVEHKEHTRNPRKVIYLECYLTWIMTKWDTFSFCNHRTCVFIQRYKNSSKRKEHIQKEGLWRKTHTTKKNLVSILLQARKLTCQHVESYSKSLVFINFQHQGPIDFL